MPISAQKHSTLVVEKSALCRQPLELSCKLPLSASSARSYELRSASNRLPLCLLSYVDMRRYAHLLQHSLSSKCLDAVLSQCFSCRYICQASGCCSRSRREMHRL